jgi:hypothetical protein
MARSQLSTDTVLDLDDPRSADPRLTGSKASWLARARHQGLAVLPGVVVTADVSIPALKRGAETLVLRGSGGARLEVGRFPVDSSLLMRVEEVASGFGSELAVRSSSVLEGDGEWSGAFASYLEIALPEVEKAIAGCWASTFTVATLERFEAVGLEPAAAPMAVLIQPAIHAEFGGVAFLHENDTVEIVGIKGSPAPLVQGWEPGVRLVTGPAGQLVDADDAIAYLGSGLISEIARQLRAAYRLTGANACEWGLADGRLALLQLGQRSLSSRSFASSPAPTADRDSLPIDLGPIDLGLIDLARLARRYPGPLGEALVLPWAGADPAMVIEASTAPGGNGEADDLDDPLAALHEAREQAAILTAAAWRMPEPIAAARAASVLRQVRGGHPEAALECLASLDGPDPERAARVLRLVAVVQRAIEELQPEASLWNWHQPIERLASILRGETQRLHQVSVNRAGTDRWEPFQAAVVESFGTQHKGIPAAPGVGYGRLCFIAGPEQVEAFRPRDVIVTIHPVPNLAPLLWEAAGLVTTGGSPAAHLFESARSLNVPAVCSLQLAPSPAVDLAASTGRFALAVDGDRGLVYSSDW